MSSTRCWRGRRAETNGGSRRKGSLALTYCVFSFCLPCVQGGADAVVARPLFRAGSSSASSPAQAGASAKAKTTERETKAATPLAGKPQAQAKPTERETKAATPQAAKPQAKGPTDDAARKKDETQRKGPLLSPKAPKRAPVDSPERERKRLRPAGAQPTSQRGRQVRPAFMFRDYVGL